MVVLGGLVFLGVERVVTSAMTSSGMGLLIGMGNTNEVQLVWDARARFCCTLASISTLLNGDSVSFSLPNLAHELRHGSFRQARRLGRHGLGLRRGIHQLEAA